MAPRQRVADHVAAFNTAVLDGRWTSFADRFAEDARMSFPDLPVPEMVGRAAILAGYQARPPDDTIAETAVESSPTVDVVSVRWSGGGTGTMRIAWDGELVAALEVTFD